MELVITEFCYIVFIILQFSLGFSIETVALVTQQIGSKVLGHFLMCIQLSLNVW